MTTADPNTTDTVLLTPEFWNGTAQDEVFEQFRSTRPISWQPEPVTEWNPVGGAGFWSVTGHELVVSVSRSPELFGSRFGTEPMDAEPKHVANAGMLNMDAPEHTRLRSIVSRVFTPKRIKAMMEGISHSAETLVDRLAGMDSFDFVAEVGETFPAGIIAGVMGVDPDDVPMLVRLTTEILSPPAERAHAANLEMIAYGSDLARRRRLEPGDDLVSHLVTAEAGGATLTEHEAGVFFALLLTAGIETTGTALNHAIVALHTFQDQRAAWVADFDGLAPTAIEEVFRWASPVRRFRRTALVDAELGGQAIKAGDKVVMWYGSANRDASVFESPHEFDLSRSPNPHVAFGSGGPHFCLGANLARAEAKSFLGTFLRALPDYRIVGPVEYATNDAFNAVVSIPCEPGVRA